MKHLNTALTTILVLLTLPFTALGQEDSESFVNFDNIVSQLSQTRSNIPQSYNRDMFDNILFHSGVGMATSHITLQSESGIQQTGFMKGVEINLGIDLFSRNWLAEGSFRSFGIEEFSHSKASLKEFDLKLTYHKKVANYIKLRTGGGLAARYLQFTDFTSKVAQQTEYTTPSSLLFLGMDAALSQVMSIGLELSYRATMIEETVDQSALDASIRVDAHF